MANISLTRIDARLVHGQVATAWTRGLGADNIVVVDDETADDDFVVDILNMALPQGVKLDVYHVEDAAKLWKENGFPSGKTILLFKTVAGAYAGFKAGIDYKELDLGQAPKIKDRINVCGTVCMNRDEFNKLCEIEDAGVKVYFQAVPYEPQIPLAKAKEKFK